MAMIYEYIVSRKDESHKQTFRVRSAAEDYARLLKKEFGERIKFVKRDLGGTHGDVVTFI